MSVGTAIRNPRAFVAGKWTVFKLILTDPERFYDELSASDRLWTEIAVLFVIGLTGVAGGYFVARELMSNIGTGTATVANGDVAVRVSGDTGLQIWGYGLRSLIGIFVLWVGFATVLYALSWLYSSRGSFFAMVKATAWALVPLFIGNLLKSIGFVIAAWNAWDSNKIQITEEVSRQLDFGGQEAARALYTQIYEEPVALVGIVIAGLTFAWCGYVAAYGVAKVRDIPVSDAYKVVAVPTALYVGYVIYQAITFVGI
ncbi:MAG: Yip1 family protein [Haloarculaceae archaeon]